MAEQNFLIAIGSPESQAYMNNWIGVTTGQGKVPGNAVDIKATFINALNRAVLDECSLGCINFATNQGVNAVGNVDFASVVGYAVLLIKSDSDVVPERTIQDLIGNQSNIAQTVGGQPRPYGDLLPRLTNLVNSIGTSIPASLFLAGGLALSDGFSVDLGYPAP